MHAAVQIDMKSQNSAVITPQSLNSRFTLSRRDGLAWFLANTLPNSLLVQKAILCRLNVSRAKHGSCVQTLKTERHQEDFAVEWPGWSSLLFGSVVDRPSRWPD